MALYLAIIMLFSLVLIAIASSNSKIRSSISGCYASTKLVDTYNIKTKSDYKYLLFLTLTFLLSISLVLSNLKGFFIDYDSMSVQLNFLIKNNISLQIWEGRFFPLSHVDNAVILKIFGNFNALKIYLVAHLLVVTVLAFVAFNFLTVKQRVFLLCLFLLCPPIVNIYSSPIYSERNILLLFLLSFYWLRKAVKSENRYKETLFIFLSVSAVYLTIFFKETTVLFIASFAASSLLFKAIKVYSDKPDWKLTLFKSIHSLETLYIFSCFLWFIAFILLGGDVNPDYVAKRADYSSLELILNNIAEITLFVLMSIVFIYRRKPDFYSSLYIATIPMMLYSVFLYKAPGAFNIYPYYNYLFYISMIIFANSLVRKKFSFYFLSVLTIFIALTVNGFIKFSSQVDDRQHVIDRLIELSHAPDFALTIDLESEWKEKNLARFLIYKIENIKLYHLHQSSLFCNDSLLYSANKTCTAVPIKNTDYFLTDIEQDLPDRELISTNELKLYSGR
ncbi:hypothetical protein [uncultured Alteromonas sp.]|uniref:hypothetical protein n=1 Tax=uncultured Alteromonas sp. TaxID=179113 RepID=UPI0030EEE8C0